MDAKHKIRPTRSTYIGILASMFALSVAILPVTCCAAAQVGVFFDREATRDVWSCHGSEVQVFTAYVIATGTEQMIGGAAYRLELDPHLQLVSAIYPAGIQIGDPMRTGVQVGFTECASGCYNTPVLISTLTLWREAWVYDAGLCITPYPPAGVVQIADCNGIIREVAGGCAWLWDPVPADVETWGAVKQLYGR